MVRLFALLFSILLFSAYIVLAKFRVEEGKIVCKEVEIQLLKTKEGSFYSTRDFQTLLKREGINVIGRPTKQINTAKIEQKLNSNEYIERAICYKTTEGNLYLSIVQKRPFFKVYSGGKSFYTTEEGGIVSASRPYNKKMLVVSGSPTESFCKGELFDFVRYIKKDKDLDGNIQEVQVSQEGELTLIPSHGKFKIVFGEIKDIDSKFEKLALFYEQGLPQVGLGRYKSIDLTYRGQVVCSKPE
ncbi:MAG TPA: hypothetical protein DDY68_02280 [Porphyromonadaceae bacterium]|nr:hypothetical protein [Porphyromonadaceae bacterium]